MLPLSPKTMVICLVSNHMRQFLTHKTKAIVTQSHHCLQHHKPNIPGAEKRLENFWEIRIEEANRGLLLAAKGGSRAFLSIL